MCGVGDGVGDSEISERIARISYRYQPVDMLLGTFTTVTASPGHLLARRQQAAHAYSSSVVLKEAGAEDDVECFRLPFRQ